MAEIRQNLHRFAHEAMATIFEVIIEQDDGVYAGQAAQAVFQEVDRLEGLLSRFNACSDLCQVNRLAPGESIRIGVDLFECLRIAGDVCEKTGGAFDVTVGALMNCLRAEDGRPLEVTNEERAEALARVGMKRLALDPDAFTVTVRKLKGDDAGGKVSLDLGGIGKGYALDRGVEILRNWGIESALLHSGTSTALALGAPRSALAGWLLGAGAEWDRAAGFGTVRLKDEALSGSGRQVKGDHILDPRTGYPARGHLAAWAITPSAATADALSTAFMVMSTAEVMDLCRSNREYAALVAVRRPGILGAFQEETIASPGFRSRSVAMKATES
jgi:thiamine biosynthesis lipoprotein